MCFTRFSHHDLRIVIKPDNNNNWFIAYIKQSALLEDLSMCM